MTVMENVEIVEAEVAGDSWSAIIGGAVAATAVSLVLLVLGGGLGLSVLSPWASGSANVATIAVGSVIWLIVVQWIGSAVGGYLTGRMRPHSESTDEVFFRDSANGFLAWSLSTLVAAAILGSAVAGVVTTTAKVAGGGVAVLAAQSDGAGAVASSYFADMLLRPVPLSPAEATAMPAPVGTQSSTTANTSDLRAEVGRILEHGLSGPEFPATDLTYLSEMVATHTGLPLDAAKTRVNDVVGAFREQATKVQAAADAARHSAAKLSIYMFLSLLVGAFIASAAAVLGGLHRNDVPAALAR
jgi:hypothetical protein